MKGRKKIKFNRMNNFLLCVLAFFLLLIAIIHLVGYDKVKIITQQIQGILMTNSKSGKDLLDEKSLEVLVREAAVDGREIKKRKKRIETSVGSEIDVSVHYKNITANRVENVLVKLNVPEDQLEYIAGSAKLIRSDMRDGEKIEYKNDRRENDEKEEDYKIGNYAKNGDGYLRFRYKVRSANWERYGGNIKIDATSFDGINLQSNWASIYVKNSELKVKQQVRLKGTKNWEDSINALEGDLIEFRIYFRNGLHKEIKNTVVQAKLPMNIELVKDSERVINKTFWKEGNDDWASDQDGELDGKGISVGNYKEGEGVYIYYTGRIVNRDLLENGEMKLTSKVKISADNISNEADNHIFVSRD